MVYANPTPYNVPAGYYDGHLGELYTPNAAQNFASMMELSKSSPVIAPTQAIQSFMGRFDDTTPVTADEANKQLSGYKLKPYTHDITQGELNERLHQAEKDRENEDVIAKYAIAKRPSPVQSMLTHLGASAVAAATDPIGVAGALLFPYLMEGTGIERAAVGGLESMGVTSRAISVGSKVNFAKGVGEAAKVGEIMGTLPLSEAFSVAGRSALPRAVQYGIGAVEGASANVLTDIAFGKPMSDALNRDFSWDDVAAGAVMGGVLGSGALWGIPGDVLRGVGDSIHARSPHEFVNKIVELTPDEIKRGVADGTIDTKGHSAEQLVSMRDDFVKHNVAEKMNEDLTPRMGGKRVTDIVSELPYSDDTKSSAILKAVQDLAQNRPVNIDPITRLDLASKISTVFNKNINKSTIKTEQLENGRFRAFIEGEQGALKDINIERAKAEDAVDDLWSLYKVNFTQSERAKTNLLKAIDTRMDTMNEVADHLKQGNKEAAIDLMEDYLTGGRTKELNRQINDLEINKAESFDIGAGQDAFTPEFNELANKSADLQKEFDSIHGEARKEAEHIIENFDEEFKNLQEYTDAARTADNLMENGGMPIDELQQIVEELKHPYGTVPEDLPIPDNSYEAQVKRNQEHIVTLEETLPKLDKQLASNKLNFNPTLLSKDPVTGKTFAEQVNRVNKIVDNIPNIISNIHDIVNNMVIGVYDIVQIAGESKPLSERIGDELKTTLADYNLHQGEVDFLANKITTMLDSTTLVDMAAKKVDQVKGYRETLIKRIDESIGAIQDKHIAMNNDEVSKNGNPLKEVVENPEVERLMEIKKQLQESGTEYHGVALEQYFPLIADALFEFENKLVHDKRTLLLQESAIKVRTLQHLSVVDAAEKHLKRIGETPNIGKIAMERLASFIGGSVNSFAGSRVSVESFQNMRSVKHARLMKDLERLGLMDIFRRADIEPMYRENLFRDLLKPKYDLVVDNASETGRIANLINKHFNVYINDYNSVGGNITKIGAMLLPDQDKMRNYASLKYPERNPELNKMSIGEYSALSRKAFIDDYIDLLDHEGMFHEKGIMKDKDKRNALGSIYDSMVYGRSVNGELFTKRAPSLLDSNDILKFKDVDSELKFIMNMASDSIEGSIKNSIDRLYNSYGLMSMFGPNPHAGFEATFKGIKSYFVDKGDEYAPVANYMQEKANGLKITMANVDGTTSTPGRGVGATIGRLFRFTQTFNLGNVLVRSIGQDPLQQTAALSLAGGRAGVSGFVDTMKFNFEGFSKYGKALSESVGIGKDVFNITVANSFNQGEMYHTVGKMPLNKHTAETHINNALKNIQDFYFSKVIFFNQYMEAMSRGTSLAWANHMAHMSENKYADLGAENITYLKEHGITEFEWNLIKDHAIKDEHDLLRQSDLNPAGHKQNRKFLVIDEIGNIPYEEFYNRYNETFKKNNEGKNLTPDRLKAMLRETQDKFDMMASDVVHSALTVPDARTMRYINYGTQPGTWGGEIVRNSMQFKAFPIAQMRQNYGKLIGRDSEFGQFNLWDNLLKGNGLVDAGGYAAAIIASNFAFQWATDVLTGKSPTDFSEKGNWIGPVADSGALGPAGLLLANSFKGDDAGRKWYENVLKNVAGPATTNTAQILGNAVVKPLYRQGSAEEKSADIGSHVAQEVINNNPIHNALFWGIGFNVLVGNHLNELLQPGYAFEKEQRLEDRTGQTQEAAMYDIWNPDHY